MSYPAAPTLCLNSIVKNESRIIRRLLDSLLGLIDSFCICDTGSTDDTVAIIQSWSKDNNIPGVIVHEPFRDFGYNRTVAMDSAAKSTELEHVADYLLLLDADMIFEIGSKVREDVAMLKRRFTEADHFTIFQGNDQFYYKNTRVVRNRAGFSYWGVTHEYVNVPSTCKNPHSVHFDRDVFFIRDIGDGGCKDNKIKRDIALLEQGLKDIPDNDRYTFYLANSYHDGGDIRKAAELYKRRTELGGWFEEVWYAFYKWGLCCAELGEWPQAIHAWMSAFQVFPDRIENIYEIVKHYRLAGKNTIAHAYWRIADDTLRRTCRHPTNPKSLDYLFLKRDVYDWKLDYEFSILGCYCNPTKLNLASVSCDILMYPALDETFVKSVLSNYKFYTPALANNAAEKAPKNWRTALESVRLPDTVLNRADFVSSTPSVVMSHDGKSMFLCTRFVNYSIDDRGGYHNKDTIDTHNMITTIDLATGEFTSRLLAYNTEHDDVYVGLEDVRLFVNTKTGALHYNANRGIGRGKIMVETGEIIINNDTDTTYTRNDKLLLVEKSNAVEKNWTLYENVDGSMGCVYGWSPFLTYAMPPQDNNMSKLVRNNVSSTTSLPNFFKHVRGSSNGVIIPTSEPGNSKNELWFLCHVVSYEDRRYYYHLFVVVDQTTMKILRWSQLFTFEKAKVEYSLGFIWMKESDTFLVGYSVMDKETKYCMIPRSSIQFSS